MKLSEYLNFNNNVELKKDGEFEILGLINNNINKKTLSFIEDKKYIKDMSKSITCVFATQELSEILPENIGIFVCTTPKYEFYLLHNYLCCNLKKYFKEKFNTKIASNSNVSNRSIISEYNVVLGKNVEIEENVIIREDVIIGDNSIIRAGSVIGGEGFSCNKKLSEAMIPGKHIGGVLIGNNVEIQYNSCIDKAIFPWDNTIIGDYTKVDNLVHIGHAAKIGRRCLITANSTIGGCTILGNDCWIGIGSTTSNNLIIGDNCRISMGAVVTKNLESGKTVSGNFAIEHSKFLEFIKKIR